MADEEKHRKLGGIIKRCRTAAIVSSLFACNISIGIVTKWTYLYGQVCRYDGQDCQAYKFPFMITAIHMLFCRLVCTVIISSRADGFPKCSFKDQFRQILPLAMISSTCVAMGNLSLKYIYPSFNQMLGSVSPLVTVLMSIILQKKRYNTWTWISMPVICGGLLVCSTEEVNYNFHGVLCVVVATALRSVQSVVKEKLLDPSQNKLDAVTLTYALAPWSGGILVAMSIMLEGSAPLTLISAWDADIDRSTVATLLALLSLGGIIASFLNIFGSLVTAHLGAVMLQILGNVKSCLAIIISCTVFRNPVTLNQSLGVVVCLFGVWLYQRKGGVLVVESRVQNALARIL